MQFAQRLKQEMESRGLTKYRLAQMVGCSQSTVANWLEGKRTPLGVMRKSLLTALDLKEEELFTSKNTPDGNVTEFIVPENGEIAAYLQKVKDEDGIMFDLTKTSSIDEIRATVAFLKTLRSQGRDSE